MSMIAYWQKSCAPYIRARFGSDERGAALVEYALLVALIAVVCIVALQLLGSSASTKLTSVGAMTCKTTGCIWTRRLIALSCFIVTRLSDEVPSVFAKAVLIWLPTEVQQGR